MRITAAVSRTRTEAPQLQELELTPPRHDEILVRIVATGVCHTDVTAHSGVLTPLPIVLGHEGAGVVEQVGSDVTELVPGDHVVLSGSSCGSCAGCDQGRPSYCDTAMVRMFGGGRLDGSSAFESEAQTERIGSHFFGQSSFATHVLSPARSAVKVPHHVPLKLLGPLACGVITGAGTVFEDLALRPQDTLAIFGVGGVGLSAVMGAHLAGVKKIIAVDQHEHRLDLARELGATDVINSTHGEPAGDIRRITGRGVDASLNTTTAPNVFTSAVDCLATQGTAVFLAAPRGDWQPPMFSMLSRGRTLRGALGGSANPQVLIPALIEHWQQGRFPFDRIITEYGFDDIAEAFADLRAGTVIKPVINISDVGTEEPAMRRQITQEMSETV